MKPGHFDANQQDDFHRHIPFDESKPAAYGFHKGYMDYFLYLPFSFIKRIIQKMPTYLET